MSQIQETLIKPEEFSLMEKGHKKVKNILIITPNLESMEVEQ